MRISDQAIDQLISLYKEDFGEVIDRAAATEMAHRLLTLYRLLDRHRRDNNAPVKGSADEFPSPALRT